MLYYSQVNIFFLKQAHSQGTAVSILLIDNLIKKNILDTDRQRIGVISMAGIE
jgi:hypothetical protein